VGSNPTPRTRVFTITLVVGDYGFARLSGIENCSGRLGYLSFAKYLKSNGFIASFDVVLTMNELKVLKAYPHSKA
jgi:hypothetical protein